MSEQGQTEVPENYRAIAQLVGAYVDDKLGEFQQGVIDMLTNILNTVGEDRAALAQVQATVGGLRDAVADLQANAGESMPEHVYKQFIRAEAERLRIVKPTRKPPSRPPEDYSGAPDIDPDTSQ